MTASTEYIRCKSLSRAVFRATGGCFWDVREGSPGNSLRLPAGTHFKIHLEGALSHQFASGICRDGKFVVLDPSGEHPTANQAVAAVRSHITATNAYLYIDFKVGDRWTNADNLRYDPELSMSADPIEKIALESAERALRTHRAQDVRGLTTEEVRAWAGRLLDEKPAFWERARTYHEENEEFLRSLRS